MIDDIALMRRLLVAVEALHGELVARRKPASRRRELLRQVAEATEHAPASWAAAAELAAILEGGRAAPAGHEDTVRRLRHDGGARSTRRIWDALQPEPAETDAVDALVRRWRCGA
jgi:hypothetical protein